MVKALVNKIIPFSSVDGPGNRLVVFLQGCNYNCFYCHNPETIHKCSQCGLCMDSCPSQAIKKDNDVLFWQSQECNYCDKCLEICSNNSSPRTTWMGVSEVLKEINRVREFISGITVSGGECTLQRDFLVEFFREVRKIGLTTFIDSNGSYPFYEDIALMDVTDKVMLDVKAFVSKEHRILTGMDNYIVLNNLRFLAQISKLYEVRIVIVPDVLDNINNVNEISKKLAKYDPHIQFKLIKFRPQGVRKNTLSLTVPTEEMIENLRNLAISNGCKQVVIV